MRIKTEDSAEATVILPDIVHRVTAAHAQIETVPRGGGDAAETGGKSMGDIVQRIGTEIQYGVVGVFCEHADLQGGKKRRPCVAFSLIIRFG